MNLSIKKGLSFGVVSGIITTLGLIVGLHSGTHSRVVVLGGIFVIAIADALSDSLGIHISEEASNKSSSKEIWQSTFATFLAKFFVAMIFIIPIILFELNIAIIASVILGLFLISIFSYVIAKQNKAKPFPIVLEHLVISIAVIVITHYVGEFASSFG